MCAALQELSDLSFPLEECDMCLYRANDRTETFCCITFFHDRRAVRGPYYKDAVEVSENLRFRGITLHTEDYRNCSQINQKTFCRTLEDSTEKQIN
jgi:hypothetical protein